MAKKQLAELTHEAYEDGKRLVVPLMGFPGVELIGSNIKLAQQNYREHFRAIRSLVEKFSPDAIFPLMDLSVEANAIGRYTIFPCDDSATVPKEAFNIDDIDRLRDINVAFDTRVIGYVETMKQMSAGLPENVLKGAYITGPYSLAALIAGADDAAMMAVLDPEALHRLCNFTTEKIQEYARMLIAAGAEVLCVLEPSAVMLGPDHFTEFSGDYVKHVISSYKYSGIGTIYHTCGNTMHLVQRMADSGVNGVSLDSRDVGVQLDKVAEKLSEDVVVIGNINPATIMLNGTPDEIKKEVARLMDMMDRYPNFILSTGCDLPQKTPFENIEAFMDAGRRHIIH